MKRVFKLIFLGVAVFIVAVFVMSFRDIPKNIVYGASFSKLHADELNLDWKATYGAILGDLGVKHIRLSAHWPMVEPNEGVYNFDELDYQMSEAAKHGADVILAVGWRLPGWPECHTPEWAENFSQQKRDEKIAGYMSMVVNRYKNAPNLRFWQVENEAFLRFATKYCGGGVEESSLDKEVALVRQLDPGHKIITTDSGEFGLWYKVRRYGDIFGTSVYLYIWHDVLGPMRYPITPGFFRFKENIVDLFSGVKPSILIELGAEPWLTKPIVETPISLQLDRMGIDKWNEVVDFARETGFGEQYLWGAEWWYYMKEKGNPEFWDAAKNLYNK